jgi:hypothetical protein
MNQLFGDWSLTKKNNPCFQARWDMSVSNIDKNPCPHGTPVSVIVAVTIQVQANYPKLCG